MPLWLIVTNVFGRRSCFDVPAQFEEESLSSGVVDVISYDEFDLDCLTKDKELKKAVIFQKYTGTAVMFWQSVTKMFR